MEPLKDPQVNLQPNLVTRDGDLGKELDKMRILLARVTGRINEAAPPKDGGTKVSETAEQKLDKILQMT